MFSFGWMPKPHCQPPKCYEAAPSQRQRSEHLEARHWLCYPTSRIDSLAPKLDVVVTVACSWGPGHVWKAWMHYQLHRNHLVAGALDICATDVHRTDICCNASLDQIYLWGSSYGNHPSDWDHLYPQQKPAVAGKRHTMAFHPCHPFQTYDTFLETCWTYDAISFW